MDTLSECIPNAGHLALADANRAQGNTGSHKPAETGIQLWRSERLDVVLFGPVGDGRELGATTNHDLASSSLISAIRSSTLVARPDRVEPTVLTV
ncbi:MAG TPA: hypothetical protein PKD24_16130 [Pyrinomonadaceae bacterium]|nr:hypothetical protein [Pyrinomonadaceae bacterium]HMP66919.1 hypothetical protein [Pyrinomonadaceae bacterium]